MEPDAAHPRSNRYASLKESFMARDRDHRGGRAHQMGHQMRDKETAQPDFTELLPAPWRIVKTEGGHYRVEDTRRRALAYVYSRPEMGIEAEYLKPDDALVIARAIARLSKTDG